MIHSVAGTPTARGGRLARAGRMWWTPEQGGLQHKYRSEAIPSQVAPDVPSDAEVRAIQDRGELSSDEELAK